MKNILQAQAANIQISTTNFLLNISLRERERERDLQINIIHPTHRLDCNRYISRIEVTNVTM